MHAHYTTPEAMRKVKISVLQLLACTGLDINDKVIAKEAILASIDKMVTKVLVPRNLTRSTRMSVPVVRAVHYAA